MRLEVAGSEPPKLSSTTEVVLPSAVGRRGGIRGAPARCSTSVPRL